MTPGARTYLRICRASNDTLDLINVTTTVFRRRVPILARFCPLAEVAGYAELVRPVSMTHARFAAVVQNDDAVLLEVAGLLPKIAPTQTIGVWFIVSVG